MTDHRSAVATRASAIVAALALGLSVLVATAAPVRAAGVRYVDEVFAEVEETADVTYGMADGQLGAEELKLDIFQPQGDTATKRPAVLYVHGGFFAPGLGNRKGNDARIVAFDLARRGYVVVSIDYRLYAGGLFDLNRLAVAIPAAMHDAETAVRYLRANAASLRIHTDAIAIGGYSAGAITALNTVFDRSPQGGWGSASSSNTGWRSDVAAGFAFAGYGGPVVPNAAPIAMFGGTADVLVPYASQRSTCDQSVAAGNVCEFHSYDGADHVGLVVYNLTTDILPKVVTFLNQRLVPVAATEERSPVASAVPGPAPWQAYFGSLASSGPAIRNGDGRLEVFGPTPGGVIASLYQRQIGLGWTPPNLFPMNGLVASGRVATSMTATDRLAMAYRATDGQIYFSAQRPDIMGWLPFRRVGDAGPTFASAPALARNQDGRLEAFAVGTDGRLMHSWEDRTNGDFSPWEALGSVLMSTAADAGPDVAAWHGRLLVVAFGADGTLRSVEQSPSGQGWGPVANLGGSGVGRPALSAFEGMIHFPGPDPTRFFVYDLRIAYRDPAGKLIEMRKSLSSSQPFTSTEIAPAGAAEVSPTRAQNADRRHEIFAGAADGTLHHSYWRDGIPGGYSPLEPLGGSCVHQPAVVQNEDQRLEVFCVAADGQMLHDFQRAPNSPWAGSSSLGGPFAA